MFLRADISCLTRPAALGHMGDERCSAQFRNGGFQFETETSGVSSGRCELRFKVDRVSWARSDGGKALGQDGERERKGGMILLPHFDSTTERLPSFRLAASRLGRVSFCAQYI